jgi:hypothetical protein
MFKKLFAQITKNHPKMIALWSKNKWYYFISLASNAIVLGYLGGLLLGF